jgi:thiamine-phosphate pyrophosphorylase
LRKLQVPNQAKGKLRGLYAITDAQQNNDRQLLADVEQALRGGASIVQYRDKSQDPQRRLNNAIALRALTQRYAALFIINDDPQLADSAQADGIHLGQDDTDIEAARTLLGQEAIIGISCYNRFELAQQASAAGADYVAFGRFFTSQTKPQARQAELDLLRRAQHELAIPVAAIGGITANNADTLIQAGADMLAVVHDLFAQDDIEAAARRYQPLFPPRATKEALG